MGKGKGEEFSEVLEQVLGLGDITRDKFFTILEMIKRKKLSSHEFFKLLEIIAKQSQSPS